MLSILLTSLLSLPLYPLNPIVQDTVNLTNMHIAAGFNGPNQVITAGPELSLKYEVLFSHPFVFRAAVDYNYGSINSKLYPYGKIHSITPSIEAFVYRGTDKLTGYLGIGIVYTYTNFKLSPRSADSLKQNHSITSVRIKNAPGYRLSLGLRIRKSYSMEMGITEIKPDFIFVTKLSETSYSEKLRKSRISDVRFTLGYLLPIKIF